MHGLHQYFVIKITQSGSDKQSDSDVYHRNYCQIEFDFIFMYCLFEVICFLYLQTIIFPSGFFIFSIIGISW